jgi:hypothetical protein
VQFDSNGVVESYEMFPDKLLAEKLAPVAQGQKLSEKETLETSITLNATEISVSLVLSPAAPEINERAHFKSLKNRPQYRYAVPRHDLQGVTVNHFQDNVTYLDVTFHFLNDWRQLNEPRGKRVSLQMSVPELIIVLAYASKYAPQEGVSQH